MYHVLEVCNLVLDFIKKYYKDIALSLKETLHFGFLNSVESVKDYRALGSWTKHTLHYNMQA